LSILFPEASSQNFGIFNNDRRFEGFLANSIVQYIRLKFGNKTEFIRSVEKICREKISRNSSSLNIALYLYQNSPEVFRKLLGVSHLIEMVHLYSFYKVLTDIFYEAPWAKNFSPLYKFIFGKEASKFWFKKEKRRYAAQIITSFDQRTLEYKYLEFSNRYGYPPVIHYGHLVTGPLGFIFSPYYREKEILEVPKPLLSVLIEKSYEGDDVIDWRSTKLPNFFSAVIKKMKSKMISIGSECPVYKQYLNIIGIDETIFENKRDVTFLSKDFKEKIMRNLIPIWFYEIVQLSGMFFTDEEAIKFLNMLIAENILVPKVSEIDLYNMKVTKDCFLLKPKSWLVTPAIDLAKDLSRSENEFQPTLTEILKTGAISFLNSLYEKSPETFLKLLDKKGLYKFSRLKPLDIPKETAIRRLLESYGFQVSAQWGFEVRRLVKDYADELREFKSKYHQLGEREIVNDTISLLGKGRIHLERIAKEFAYILTILLLSLKRVVEQNVNSREKYLSDLKRQVYNFLGSLLDPETFGKFTRHKMALGHWFTLIRHLFNYLERSGIKEVFHKELTIDVKTRLEDYKHLINCIEKDCISAQLNKSSHEEGMREIMIDADSRKRAIDVLLNFDAVLIDLYSSFPPLARITREVKEVETGLEYYEAKILDRNFEEKTIKIYGTRLIDPSETYYVFMQKSEEEKEFAVYPLMVTNLVDLVF